MITIRSFVQNVQTKIDFAGRERNHDKGSKFQVQGFCYLHRNLEPGKSILLGKTFNQFSCNTAGREATIVHQILHGHHSGIIRE